MELRFVEFVEAFARVADKTMHHYTKDVINRSKTIAGETGTVRDSKLKELTSDNISGRLSSKSKEIASQKPSRADVSEKILTIGSFVADSIPPTEMKFNKNMIKSANKLNHKFTVTELGRDNAETYKEVEIQLSDDEIGGKISPIKDLSRTEKKRDFSMPSSPHKSQSASSQPSSPR